MVVVDEYYCSEITTAQACLGLGCRRTAMLTCTDEDQPA